MPTPTPTIGPALGKPVIFFDSHPSEQESYLYSYWSTLKGQLHTAWTGVVPPFLEPGHLRIIWYTHDKSKGLKDYELHQYELVRDQFDSLLTLDEIRRVVVIGYGGQNPYIMGGKNPWTEKLARDRKRVAAERRQRTQWQNELQDESKEVRAGTSVNIEKILAQADYAEEQRIRAEEARLQEQAMKGDKGMLLNGDSDMGERGRLLSDMDRV